MTENDLGYFQRVIDLHQVACDTAQQQSSRLLSTKIQDEETAAQVTFLVDSMALHLKTMKDYERRGIWG